MRNMNMIISVYANKYKKDMVQKESESVKSRMAATAHGNRFNGRTINTLTNTKLTKHLPLNQT